MKGERKEEMWEKVNNDVMIDLLGCLKRSQVEMEDKGGRRPETGEGSRERGKERTRRVSGSGIRDEWREKEKQMERWKDGKMSAARLIFHLLPFLPFRPDGHLYLMTVWWSSQWSFSNFWCDPLFSHALNASCFHSSFLYDSHNYHYHHPFSLSLLSSSLSMWLITVYLDYDKCMCVSSSSLSVSFYVQLLVSLPILPSLVSHTCFY